MHHFSYLGGFAELIAWIIFQFVQRGSPTSTAKMATETTPLRSLIHLEGSWSNRSRVVKLISSFPRAAECPNSFAEGMIRFGHPAIRIALLQVVAIIGGVFLARAVFMVYEYPNNGVDFGAVPTLIRNFGFLLLAVPVAWTISSVWLEERPDGFWTRRWTIITGVAILGLLVWLLYYSFSYPGNWGVGPVQSVSLSSPAEQFKAKPVQTNFHSGLVARRSGC